MKFSNQAQLTRDACVTRAGKTRLESACKITLDTRVEFGVNDSILIGRVDLKQLKKPCAIARRVVAQRLVKQQTSRRSSK